MKVSPICGEELNFWLWVYFIRSELQKWPQIGLSSMVQDFVCKPTHQIACSFMMQDFHPCKQPVWSIPAVTEAAIVPKGLLRDSHHGDCMHAHLKQCSFMVQDFHPPQASPRVHAEQILSISRVLTIWTCLELLVPNWSTQCSDSNVVWEQIHIPFYSKVVLGCSCTFSM